MPVSKMFRFLAFFFLLEAPLAAWTLPGSYKSMQPYPVGDAMALSHVVVEVNGLRALVKADETFTVVQGDVVLIEEAFLNRREFKPEQLNLVGFSASKGKPNEDRGTKFNTAAGFDDQWAVDPMKTTHVIAAVSKKRLHGVVFLKIIKPQLKFADVLVNEKVRVMREGEVLVLRATDKIKIQSVVTNMEKNDDVNFEIIKTKNNEIEKMHLRQASAYEIRFSRQSQVFAKIPMLVEGL